MNHVRWRLAGACVPFAFLLMSGGLSTEAHAQRVEVIHQFTALADQGQYPIAPPVYDVLTGKLYGVTQRAGANASGYGVNVRALIYSLSPSDAAFTAAVSAYNDASTTLVQDGQGNFYFGVEGNANRLLRFTRANLVPELVSPASGVGLMGLRGGLSVSPNDEVFFPISYGNQSRLARLSQGGTTEIKVWDSYAVDSQDVHVPAATVIAGNGYLYGVADSHSAGAGSQAVLYRIRLDGSGYAKLKVFDVASGYPVSARYLTGGERPIPHALFSGLVDGGDGWLYGTTFRANAMLDAAADTKGTVYRIAIEPGGNGSHAFEVVHRFTGGEQDGEAAHGPLVLGSDGHVYGTTLRGGKDGKGTMFQVKLHADPGDSVPQGAFVPVYAKLLDFADAGAESPVGLSAHVSQPGKAYGATARGGADDAGTVFIVTLPEPPAAPVHFSVPLTATPGSGQAPLSVSLSWTADNVSGACQAATLLDEQPSDVWHGDSRLASVADERVVLDAPGAYVFTLTCANADGVPAISQVVVSVTSRPADPSGPVAPGNPEAPTTPTEPSDTDVNPPTGGGALGGLLVFWMCLCALASWRRRG